jgi:tetratricopeptide (TPR) repeat protein
MEGRTGCTVRALLFARMARAYALLGNARECASALAVSEQAWENRDCLPAPSWGYWVTSATLVGDAGRAWLDLGRHDKAEAELVRSLHLLGDGQPRDRSLHLTSLAETRINGGNIEGAADATREAIRLAGQTDSARTQSRLRKLELAFTGHTGLASAREASEMIDFSLHDGKIA